MHRWVDRLKKKLMGKYLIGWHLGISYSTNSTDQKYQTFKYCVLTFSSSDKPKNSKNLLTCPITQQVIDIDEHYKIIKYNPTITSVLKTSAYILFIYLFCLFIIHVIYFSYSIIS